MRLTIELDYEEDGRTIASVVEIPGLHVYGEDDDDAVAKAQALALIVIADRIEHGENPLGGAPAPSA